MPDINYELSFLLPVATTLVLGFAALSICRFERVCRKLLSFWNSPTGTALQESPSDIASLESQLSTLQSSMDSVIQAIDVLQQRQVKSQPEKDHSLPLENAVRMVKHGATTDELTKTCGLNIGEAHLLRRLHADSRPSRQLAS